MNQKKRTNWWLSIVCLSLLVLALAGCGSSSSPPIPAAPTGVTVATGDTQATISWTASTGADSYNIYYSTTTGVTPANGTKVSGATSPKAVTGLINGTPYYFVVTAVNAYGESAASSQVTATPITKPSGITVSADNATGQVTAAWLSVPGATSYNVYYGTTNPVSTSNYLQKITVSSAAAGTSNGTPFFTQTVTGLTNTTTYYFAVTAANAGGETVLSSQKSVVPGSGIPGSPVAVTVSSTAAGQVHMVWGDYVPDATGYNAYYLQQTAQPTTAQIIVANQKVALTAPSPNNLPFTSGLTYWFVVRAVNSNTAQESGGQTNPKSVLVQ